MEFIRVMLGSRTYTDNMVVYNEKAAYEKLAELEFKRVHFGSARDRDRPPVRGDGEQRERRLPPRRDGDVEVVVLGLRQRSDVQAGELLVAPVGRVLLADEHQDRKSVV